MEFLFSFRVFIKMVRILKKQLFSVHHMAHMVRHRHRLACGWQRQRTFCGSFRISCPELLKLYYKCRWDLRPGGGKEGKWGAVGGVRVKYTHETNFRGKYTPVWPT